MTTEQIKKQAKELKKIAAITHSQALELIVRNLGYHSWNHYCALKGESNETNENVKITIKKNFQKRTQNKI